MEDKAHQQQQKKTWKFIFAKLVVEEIYQRGNQKP